MKTLPLLAIASNQVNTVWQLRGTLLYLLHYERKQNLISQGTIQQTASTPTESSSTHVGLFIATIAHREIYDHI